MKGLKKGVPTTRREIEAHRKWLEQFLSGLPKTNAVEKRIETPQQKIKQLEATIQIYERQAEAEGKVEAQIRAETDDLRLELLRMITQLAPEAKRQARRGKPALLRLIGRTLRSIR